MSTVFPKESEQYEFAQIPLLKYLDEFRDDKQWELRSKVRADTISRCQSGLPVRKQVLIRRAKEVKLLPKQTHSMLHVLNSRNPYNELSRDLILFLAELPPDEGFNCGDIALRMFGPSDKYYEKGMHEQNIKMKIRRMEHENLLALRKMKYYFLPAFFPFAEAVKKLSDMRKFDKGVLL